MPERRTYSPEHLQAARDAVRIGCAILRGDDVLFEPVTPKGPLPLGVTLDPALVFGPFIRWRCTPADVGGDRNAEMAAERQIRELSGTESQS